MALILLILLPLVGGFVCWWIGRAKPDAFAWQSDLTILVCLLELALSILLLLGGQSFALPGFCVQGLTLAAAPLQTTLAILASFIWLGAALFSREYMAHGARQGRFFTCMLWSLCGTQGVFLAGDLYTAFIFFEFMSFTSYVLVKQEETERALRAGQLYLAIAVAAGLVTLLGLFFLNNLLGTLSFEGMLAAAQNLPDRRALYAAGLLTLTGFAAKAGMFPLHVWLPEAHPAAPAPASALLSCVLTKTGVFGILALTAKVFLHDAQWGLMLLIPGAITMVLGAVLALLSIDLKRTLACSSLSQIGFVLVGVAMQGLLGEENVLAVYGTLGHIVNHALIKLTLFTAAGVVYMNLHKLDLNEIRGYGRNKPFLMVCFLLCALGIAGIPFFNGYASKTLLHESLAEYAGGLSGLVKAVEWLFIVSGGLTLGYMTKLFVAIFVEKGQDWPKGRYMSPRTAGVLLMGTIPVVLLGVFPNQLLLPIAGQARAFSSAEALARVDFFSKGNLLGAVYTLAIGAFAYLVVVRGLLRREGRYLNGQPQWLSLENVLYRPLATNWLPKLGFALMRIPDGLADGLVALLGRWLFNRQDDRSAPPEDEYFGQYADEPFVRRGFTDTLAFSFLLLGLGVVIGLLFILLH